MRILIVDTYYRIFLENHYRAHGALEKLGYEQQRRSLMDSFFGTSDYYSRNLKLLGHEAEEIVANCLPLQWKWAEEHGVRVPRKLVARRLGPLRVPWLGRDSWLETILKAQVESYRPDVIHVQDPEMISAAVLRELRSHTQIITCQIASGYSQRVDWSQYDLALSSFPHFVERFRGMGLRSEYFRLGFEPSVLARLESAAPRGVAFVGGMSRGHADRIQFFEALARSVPLDWWGYGIENLAADSPLRRSHRGFSWALEMYQRLRNAKIALNHHIDVAESCANNMRLFEATGVGTLLLTDAKPNLSQMFEPGKEVATYANVEECAEKIRYYLDHEDERAAIAKAGQTRTLAEHTYFHRMEEYWDSFEGYFDRSIPCG